MFKAEALPESPVYRQRLVDPVFRDCHEIQEFRQGRTLHEFGRKDEARGIIEMRKAADYWQMVGIRRLYREELPLIGGSPRHLMGFAGQAAFVRSRLDKPNAAPNFAAP